MTRGRVLATVVRTAVAMLTAACASQAGSLYPSATVTTTNPSYPNWFKLDWTVESLGPSDRRIEGYVYNTYGRPAEHVRLLAQALDASGDVVDQRLQWMPGGIPALSRSYFSVDHLPAADHYRVSIWSFDFVMEPRWRFP